MLSRHAIGVFCCVLGALLALPKIVHANEASILDLNVQEILTVYAEPKPGAKAISRLVPGDKVVISPVLYNGFRKVMVIAGGKPTAGYIPIRSLHRSSVRVRLDEKTRAQRSYFSSKALGVAVMASFLRQPTSSFRHSDGIDYETSVFQSQSYFVSVFGDIGLTEKWGLRAYLALRETHFKGTATSSVNPEPITVNRDQKLTGLGLIAKRYTSPQGSWWWGPGIELAQGNQISLKVNDSVAPTTNENLPFFLILYGTVGVDLRFFGLNSLFFVPDLRAGMIVSTSPTIVYVESLLGLAYRF